jgi:hypothetical protein
LKFGYEVISECFGYRADGTGGLVVSLDANVPNLLDGILQRSGRSFCFALGVKHKRRRNRAFRQRRDGAGNPEKETAMVKRIMRAFKISEVSAVDKPAQEGARMVIMKRDSAGDISSAVTELSSSNARFDKLLRALKEPATTVVSLAERRHTIGKGATPMPVFDTDRNVTIDDKTVADRRGRNRAHPRGLVGRNSGKGGSPLWRPSPDEGTAVCTLDSRR